MKYGKIALILFIALVLRLIAIDQSLWLDEATTALVAGKSLQNYFTNFAPGDFHPPLYYLSEIAIVRVFGNSEISLRLLSIVSGVGSVYLVYLITLCFSKRRTALIAALFAATSGLLIYYSQEARMYMLATFLVSGAVYSYLKKKDYLFVLFLAGSVLAHYLTVFIFPIFWISELFLMKDKKSVRKFIVSNVIVFVLVIWWVPIFMKQFGAGLSVESTSPRWWNILGRTTIKEIMLVPTKFFLGRIPVNTDLLYSALVGIVGIVYLCIVFRAITKSVKNKWGEGKTVIFLWLTLPVFLAGALGLFVPVFSYFRLLFVLPSLYIFLALGIEAMDKNLASLAVCFVLTVNIMSSCLYLFNQQFQREDWKGLVRTMNTQSQGKVGVVFVKNSQMEAYDYYKERFGAPEVVPVHQLDAGYSTIWLMRYVQPIFDPSDTVRMTVEYLGYQKKSEYDFNGVVVWEYK